MAAEFEARARAAAELATREPLLRVDTRFLSDTLVFATEIPHVWGDRAPAQLAAIQRVVMAQAVAKMLQACAVSTVPLIFRGAIADGPYLFDGNQILGEAIDEAALRMNIADAAVVWFGSPMVPDPSMPHIPYWADYEMPLRDGRRLNVQAVNPFIGCPSDQIDAVYEGMIRAFGNTEDVGIMIKRNNTAMFLMQARREWTASLQAQSSRPQEAAPLVV